MKHSNMQPLSVFTKQYHVICKFIRWQKPCH